MRVDNDALRLDVGRHYRVHTKDGDVVTGRLAVRSVERVWLVSGAGQFSVFTGEICRIDILHQLRS